MAGKRPQAGQSRGWARPQRPDSRFGQACPVVAGTVGSRPRSRPCRIRHCSGMTNPPSAILMREPNVLPATPLRRSCIEGLRPTCRCAAACALSSVASKPRRLPLQAGAWRSQTCFCPSCAAPRPTVVTLDRAPFRLGIADQIQPSSQANGGLPTIHRSWIRVYISLFSSFSTNDVI